MVVYTREPRGRRADGRDVAGKRVPEPVRDRDPARLRGLGGDVPVLRALRRGAPRSRREPLLVLELDALPACRCRPSTWPASTARTRRSACGRTGSSRCRRRWASTTASSTATSTSRATRSPTRTRSPSGRSSSSSARATTTRTGTSSTAKFKEKMQALIAEITELHVPDLPEYEPDEVAFEDDRNTSFYEVLAAYDRTLRCLRPDVAAPLRVPAARLRRVHDVLRVLQEPAARTSPTSTSRRWSPGIDVLLFKPTRSCAGWRSWRSTRASTAPSSRGARRTRSTPSWRESDAGRAWLEELERDQGPLVQHGDRRRPLPLLPQLVRRPEHPVRVGRRPRRGAPGRRGGRAPDRGARARARPARRGVRRAARRGAAQRRSTSCSRSRARSSPTSRSTSSSATTGS